ncbi:Hypothetical predicted protein [Marmota monax]|uniref:Uncharacterized protein n=1 Tax=Marmota monax TaxID=9995 RepID=A0A5E4BAC6_MARMO|nr:Hypothetical predicted protein [Marmota monax]
MDARAQQAPEGQAAEVADEEALEPTGVQTELLEPVDEGSRGQGHDVCAPEDGRYAFALGRPVRDQTRRSPAALAVPRVHIWACRARARCGGRAKARVTRPSARASDLPSRAKRAGGDPRGRPVPGTKPLSDTRHSSAPTSWLDDDRAEDTLASPVKGAAVGRDRRRTEAQGDAAGACLFPWTLKTSENWSDGAGVRTAARGVGTRPRAPGRSPLAGMRVDLLADPRKDSPRT